MSNVCKEISRDYIKANWKFYMILLWPILCLLIFLIGHDKKIRVLYIIVMLVGYWISDCMHEGIVALFSVFLVPLLGIYTAETTYSYFSQNLFATAISMCNSVVVEHSRLHERLTFWIIIKLKASLRSIHITLVLLSSFCSCWMSNAMAAQMMLPIVTKILDEIDIDAIEFSQKELDKMSMVRISEYFYEPKPSQVAAVLYTGVAYSASIGGLSYIGGTYSNLVFKTLYQHRFRGCFINIQVWFVFLAPFSVVTTIIVGVITQIIFLKLCLTKKDAVVQKVNAHLKSRQIIQSLYDKLGPITFHEVLVGVLFFLVITLWFVFSIKQVRETFEYADGTVFSYLIAFLYLLVPSHLGFVWACSKDPKKRPIGPSPGVAIWEAYNKRVIWLRPIIIGASAILGKAQFDSGLAKFLASYFQRLKGTNYIIIVAVSTFLTSCLTETLQNAVVCMLVMPFIIELAVVLDIHPFWLGLPNAMMCASVFLWKRGTPGLQKVMDTAQLHPSVLVKAGILPKILMWLFILVWFLTYGMLFYSKDKVLPRSYQNLTCYCEPCIPFNYSNYGVD